MWMLGLSPSQAGSEPSAVELALTAAAAGGSVVAHPALLGAPCPAQLGVMTVTH